MAALVSLRCFVARRLPPPLPSPRGGGGKTRTSGRYEALLRWCCLSVLHRTPPALTPALSPRGEGARQGRGVSRLLFICAPGAFDGMGGCCIAPSPLGEGWDGGTTALVSLRCFVARRLPPPLPSLRGGGRKATTSGRYEALRRGYSVGASSNAAGPHPRSLPEGRGGKAGEGCE